MGCIYEDFDGNCTVYDKNIEMLGCPDGMCIVSSDPDPSETCDQYSSDNVCLECGADLNVEYCDCNDEKDE